MKHNKRRKQNAAPSLQFGMVLLYTQDMVQLDVVQRGCWSITSLLGNPLYSGLPQKAYSGFSLDGLVLLLEWMHVGGKI